MSSSTNIQAHGGLRHGQARRLHRRKHDQGRQSTDNHARRQVADMTTSTTRTTRQNYNSTQGTKAIPQQYANYAQTGKKFTHCTELRTKIHTTKRRPSEPGKASVDEGVTYTTGNQLQGPQHEDQDNPSNTYWHTLSKCAHECAHLNAYHNRTRA